MIKRVDSLLGAAGDHDDRLVPRVGVPARCGTNSGTYTYSAWPVASRVSVPDSAS